ncbi:MAG: hypothetical protein NZ807_08300, partial [Dehalococcoidia bacterium]|nr:hypothetical protein [Dehalococcoidia bacterium]
PIVVSSLMLRLSRYRQGATETIYPATLSDVHIYQQVLTNLRTSMARDHKAAVVPYHKGNAHIHS